MSRYLTKKIYSFPVWLIASFVIYAALLITASVIKLQYGLYNSFDLAISNQVFWNSIHGNLFESSIQPPSYLSYHFALVNILFLPFYKIFATPATLLVIQTIALAAAAFPLYRISKKYVSERWTAVITSAWLLNPFVHSINLFEWHNTSVIPFAIMMIWYFFIEKKQVALLITIVLTTLIREEAAYAVASMGLLMLVSKNLNSKALKVGTFTFVIGMAWFFIALELINQFQPDERYVFLHYYGWLGSSFSEVIKNAITQPLVALKGMLNKNALEMFVGLLLPLTFVPLLKPKYLLGAAIPIGVLLLGQIAKFNILFLHYSAIFIASMFIAYIYGVTYIKNRWKHFEGLSALILIIGIVYSFTLMSPLPHTLAAPFSNDQYVRQADAREKIVEAIPNKAGVIVTKDFATALSQRQTISRLWYLFNNTYQFSNRIFEIPNNTEYIAFSPQELMVFHGLAIPREGTEQRFPGERLGSIIENEYTLVKAEGPYLLFKKDREQSETYQIPGGIDGKVSKKLSDSLTLHGYTIEPLEGRVGNKLKITLYLEKTKPIDEFINFKVESSAETNIIPPSLGLYTIPSWEENIPMKTTLLVDPDEKIKITPISFIGERVVNRYASQQYNILQEKIQGETFEITIEN